MERRWRWHHYSGVYIRTFGRVSCKRDAVIGALRRGFTRAFWLLANASMGAHRSHASKPVGYSVTTPSGTRGVVSPTGMKNVYKARLLGRAGVQRSTGVSLAMFIDKEKNYIFKP